RIALSFGNSGSERLWPKSSRESRWIRARRRTFDPQGQVAGSVAKFSTWLYAPQMLQVKETTEFYSATNGGAGLLQMCRGLAEQGFGASGPIHEAAPLGDQAGPSVGRSLGGRASFAPVSQRGLDGGQAPVCRRDKSGDTIPLGFG